MWLRTVSHLTITIQKISLNIKILNSWLQILNLFLMMCLARYKIRFLWGFDFFLHNINNWIELHACAMHVKTIILIKRDPLFWIWQSLCKFQEWLVYQMKIDWYIYINFENVYPRRNKCIVRIDHQLITVEFEGLSVYSANKIKTTPYCACYPHNSIKIQRLFSTANYQNEFLN